MPATRRILVTGAGGFIGHHLVNYLKRKGFWVRGVDVKRPEYEATGADEFLLLDLRHTRACEEATQGVDQVYALAADMGGMGFIAEGMGNDAKILHNNSLIDIHTIEATRLNGVERVLYSSSACVYPESMQVDSNVTALREENVYPACPQDAYGWQKLLSERLCQAYRLSHGLQTRIARLHNIYGPLGTWEGGREKAPAALCRKVAMAKLKGDPEVEIWGDGQQTRSFCFIDDCTEGLYRLMNSTCAQPVNLGSERLISIDDLADLVARIARVPIVKKHVAGPEGVRGRNSDNTRLRQVLDWEPQVSLEQGLAATYNWIEQRVEEKLRR